MAQTITEIYRLLRPFIQRQINEAVGGGEGRRSAPAAGTMGGDEWEYAGNMRIDANSAVNTVISIINQGTGTASLDVEGNIVLGGTVDGVDVSAHAANANAHHAQSHVLATHLALGADHTISGATAGHVLRASSATAAAFAAIADGDLPATIVRTSRQVISGAGLTGGGDLSGDRTLAVGAGLGITVNADDVALTTPGSLTATSTNSSTGSHTHAVNSTIARSAITITAGAGLTGGGDLTANRTVAVGAGTMITVNADDVALSVGTAQYQMITTGASPFTPGYVAISTLAGAGLTHSAGVLAVGAGLGLTVNADDVALTTPGSLTATSTNSSTGSHTHAIDATIARSAIQIVSGAGLTGGGDLTTSRTLAVGAGTLITVGADDVGITAGSAYQFIGTGAGTAAAWQNMSTLAGAGLTHSAGVLAVGAGLGLTVNADDVALTTPGTLTASTTNSSTGNHTHAVTTGAASTLSVSTANGAGSSASLARADHLHAIASSAAPGAAASLLATDSSGALSLTKLGVGVAAHATYKLYVLGDSLLDGHIETDSLDVNGAAAVYGGDLRVFNSGDFTTPVLYVDESLQAIGVNRDPDAQFSLDVAGALRADWLIGPHAIQLDDAEAIMHFDGPGPYETNYTGTSQTHKGAIGTVSGGVIYRPGKFGKSAQVAASATNLIVDPSLENATLTNWTASGTFATNERSTDYVWVGSYSRKLVNSSGSDATLYTAATVAATSNTLTARVRLSTGAAVTSSIVTLYFNGAEVTPSSYTALDDGWYLLRYGGTPTAGSRNFGIVVTTGYTVYLDGVQLEATAYATPYCDGSLGLSPNHAQSASASGTVIGGHTWTGTEHASTSSRTAASLAYSTRDLPETAGTVMAWIYVAGDTAGITRLLRCNGTSAGYIMLTANGATNTARAYWGTSEIAGDAVPVGEWHHLAMSYDGTTLRLYQNGAETASGSSSGFVGMPATFTVGATVGGASQHVNGFVDELVILSRAADAEEILSIYESNAPVFAESSTNFFKSYGPTPVEINEEGLWVEGPTVGAIFGIYGASATKSWGGVTLAEGDVLLGRSPSYVLWDDSASLITVNAKMLVRDDSEFTGTVTIGTSGGIYQGTGTFASPTTGLKIWNDGGVGRIGGYNTGALQWYASTDGKLYAGAGAVALDASGISITTPTTDSYVQPNSLSFVYSGAVIGSLDARATAGSNLVYLKAAKRAANSSDVFIQADAPATGSVAATVTMEAWRDSLGRGGSVTAAMDSSGNGYAGIYSRTGSFIITDTYAYITSVSGVEVTGILTLPNTGLHLLDTNASHDLIIAPGSNLDADYTLSLVTGNANRTLTLSGNATLNQDVSSTGTPAFAQLTVDNLGLNGNTISSSSGVIALTPLAGQNVQVNLSGGGTLDLRGDSSANVNTLRFVDTDTSSAANQVTGRLEFYTSDATPGPAGVHSWIAGATHGTSGLGYLQFATGQSGSAAEAVRIASTGNVIIASTTDSGYKLDVTGTFRATSTAYLTDIRPVSDSTTAMQFKQSGGTAFVTLDSTNKRMGINKTPGAYDLDVNGTARVGSDLYLGVGRIRPVADSTAGIMFMDALGPSWIMAIDTDNFRVGIGVDHSPAETLDVLGTMHVSGDFWMDGIGYIEVLGIGADATDPGISLEVANGVNIGSTLYVGDDATIIGELSLSSTVNGYISRQRTWNQSIAGSSSWSTGVTISSGEFYLITVTFMSTSNGTIVGLSSWMASRTGSANRVDLAWGTSTDVSVTLSSNIITINNANASTRYVSVSLLRTM